MGRARTGSASWLRNAWYVRVWIGGKREAFRLAAPTRPEEKDAADARARAMVEMQAKLEETGHPTSVPTIMSEAAKARSDRQLALVKKFSDQICEGGRIERGKFDGSMTFRQFAEAWTEGELHKQWPDHVRKKRTAETDAYRLKKHVYPYLGTFPLPAIGLEHAEEVMRRCELTEPSSRRQVAQLIHRVMQLAWYPARLITSNPIPKGFLPALPKRKARSYLYPVEEAKLLATRAVPVTYRMLYGFLDREGMRKSEAHELTWDALDLERGAVRLDINKTDQPRAWALRPDVVRALKIWKERAGAKKSPRVFVGIEWDHLAAMLRDHLQLAEIARGELFERSAHRRRIVAHDLRATFVTLSLASGKTESWVQDRTGHTSSDQINRYRQAARTAAELSLGELGPLDTAIPELAEVLADDEKKIVPLRRVK